MTATATATLADLLQGQDATVSLRASRRCSYKWGASWALHPSFVGRVVPRPSPARIGYRNPQE